MSGAFYLDQTLLDLVRTVEEDPAINEIMQGYNNTPAVTAGHINPILQINIVTPDPNTTNLTRDISAEDPAYRDLTGDMLAEDPNAQ